MMTTSATVLFSLLALGLAPDETVIRVDADRVIHRISPLLYGACIEDVNHEIYGGLYSQMIFGESFGEAPRPLPLKGFSAYGGRWAPGAGGEVAADPGDGPKLVAEGTRMASGEVAVDVRFPSDVPGNAGLILKVDRPRPGADSFTGYEVSLETSGRLVLGRHRRNWEPIRTIPCPVPVDRWINLAVKLGERSLEVSVDGRVVATFEDSEHPLAPGLVGLRTWQRPARFRDLRVKVGDSAARPIAFEREAGGDFGEGVSGMWDPFVRAPRPESREGPANGEFAIETREPFVGRQAQRITASGGRGEVGIENRGLNRWGMNLVEGRPYEGYIWARAAKATPVAVALETGDGGRVLAEKVVEVRDGDAWSRYDFALTPGGADRAGRFAIKLKGAGSVEIGHAFLQPGEWGRFKGLPVRKDVADAMVAQGLTVLRFGGSVVNHAEYRWKKMIGPRDRRPPHSGTWYAHSTNGWGIVDFLDFCEAAGFASIPAFNADETAGDMADFVEYANGPADSTWGRKRAADGHPEPYRLRHVEIGNEEAVNEAYWRKFRPIAEAMWAKDPALILVVGDFAYSRPIEDPYHFPGGASTDTLAAHRKILELAKEHGREVWFDVHISTNRPPEPNGLRPERSYIEQLGKIAPGARYKVVIFEYNSGNHAQRRALSNALATNEVERIGEILPIACSANALQPDGQNDNGWDQGLLFLDPSKAWLQPPGYLIRMTRCPGQPLLVASEVRGPAEKLSVNAKKGEDGKSLALQVVHWGDEPLRARIDAPGFTPARPSAVVDELAGPLDAANTAAEPDRIAPVRSEWRHGMDRGEPAWYTFPARSITVIHLD